MKNVEVLLREDVHRLGRVGDIVKVAPGYARNFLVPRRLAVQASADNVRAMTRRRERIEAEEAARAEEFQARVDALAAISVTTVEKADEAGHLFGSVSAAAVARLVQEAGHDVQESQVRLDHPIKAVGEHKVAVHVHGALSAEITVVVEAETEA